MRFLKRNIELLLLFVLFIGFTYFDVIGNKYTVPVNMPAITSALCSVFGSLVGFSIAALGIVFAIIQKPEYNILFKHSHGEDFFHAFKLNQLISFFGFSINGVAMIDQVSLNKHVATLIVCILLSWICSFFKLVSYFNSLVDAEIKIRKPKS